MITLSAPATPVRTFVPRIDWQPVRTLDGYSSSEVSRSKVFLDEAPPSSFLQALADFASGKVVDVDVAHERQPPVE